MTTGSEKLDGFAKKVKYCNQFHLQFANGVLEALTRRSTDYQICSLPGGFSVNFNGLEAEFKYECEGRLFRIRNGSLISSRSYALTETNLQELVEKFNGDTSRLDFDRFCNEMVNPALERQISAGYSLDNLN